MLKQIYISTSFEGIHKWKNAPKEVKFLRKNHRHIFNVKVWFEVSHNDRDLEFFIMKQKVNDIIHRIYDYYDWIWQCEILKVWSCEMIAQDILEELEEFTVTKIEINEDWENWIEFIS